MCVCGDVCGAVCVAVAVAVAVAVCVRLWVAVWLCVRVAVAVIATAAPAAPVPTATAHRANYKSYQRDKAKLQCRRSALAEAASESVRLQTQLDDLIRQADESLSMAAAVAKGTARWPVRSVMYFDA